MRRTAEVGVYSKEYILSLEKTIDDNNCWRSLHSSNGKQVQISIEGYLYVLSRLVMCLWHNVDYLDHKIIARHRCNNAFCFNPEHLIPGSDSDNVYDSVKAGTHRQTQKEVCPKCGGPYRSLRIKDRLRGIVRIARRCENCRKKRRMEKYHEAKSVNSK